MVEPTTLRSSSVSAVRRETSSPLRLRSKNAWSSPTRCEYRRSRRSATTRSPSSETKKKRAAVASASASATANTSAKVALMLPPPEKPWSIIRRTTRGRLRVAVLDAASDTSQATSRPLWRRTNGHSARRLPSRGLGLSAASGAAVVSGARSGPVSCPGMSAITLVVEAHPVTGGVAQAQVQGVDIVGGQAQQQAGACGVEGFGQFLGRCRRQRGVDGAQVLERRVQGEFAHVDQRHALGAAQAFGDRKSVV